MLAAYHQCWPIVEFLFNSMIKVDRVGTVIALRTIDGARLSVLHRTRRGGMEDLWTKMKDFVSVV